jgi:hypothetical protein
MSLDDRLENINSNLNLEDLSRDYEGKVREISRIIYYQNRKARNDKDVLFTIIDITKCEVSEAEKILEKMKSLGLGLCMNVVYEYDFELFVGLRGFVDPEELREKSEKIQEELRQQEERIEKWEKEFFSKYGEDDSKWSEKTWKEYFDYDPS